jgi:hypothetical protein
MMFIKGKGWRFVKGEVDCMGEAEGIVLKTDSRIIT